ncbi:FAR1 DNA binding domain [Macleaya cordata]|uniref:FAR1 DNA binding domain n=1 Tax=Macleaya cordata TaxID=56857 RepID=A0A200R8W7_MACCD|nr:FAR1 DNA binding domain [Macleaya cordata]
MESTSRQGDDLMGNNMASEGETSCELETEECDDTSRNDSQLVELTGVVGPSEPYIGMEFKSADDGREYYGAYARRNGFTIRVNRKRRSRIDCAVIGFDYVCSKEGFRPKRCLGEDRTIMLSKQSRVGCRAILVIAYRREIEKWVVTNFVREHNHDLMGPSELLVRRSSVKASTEDEKDKRIRELTAELYNERQRFQRRCSAYEERCAAYKVQLGKILKDVELHSDHLTERVPGILQTIKEIEDEYFDSQPQSR